MPYAAGLQGLSCLDTIDRLRTETRVISLHRTAHCTGVWRREQSDSLMFWRCDSCRALAASSKEVNRAVIQERVLGRELEQLAGQGRRLLEEG